MSTTTKYAPKTQDYQLILRSCLAWREKGYSVLPLRGKNPNSDLLPRKNGKPSWGILRDKPATSTKVREWFTKDPQANFGIITGRGLVVVDVDHPELLPDDLHLSPSYMVSTGRGYHVYYRYSGYLKTKTYPWGEFRAVGGYIVGPGSIHPETQTVYEPLDDSLETAELPDHLREYFQKHQEKGKKDATRTEYSVLVAPRSYPQRDQEKGIDVRSYFCSPEIAIRAMRLMGYDDADEMGKHFRCPWHDDDTQPSAALFQGEDSQVFIHDFHCLDQKGEWLTLPDIYAKWVSGQAEILSHAGYAVWGIRLLDELGEITLPEIETPDLPDNAPQSVKKLWAGFCHLLQVREFYLPHQNGTPFSFGFACSWCHFNDRTAVSRAFKWLQDKGLLTALPKQKKADATMYSLAKPAEEVDVESHPARVPEAKLDDWLRGKVPPAMAHGLDTLLLANERGVA